MLKKRAILRLVKWLCQKLNYDELLIAAGFILEVISGVRTDIKLKKTPQKQYPNYRKYDVDPTPPITYKPVKQKVKKKYNYKELLDQYRSVHGKELKPVSRRKNSFRPPEHIHCPCCGAPSTYIYVNDGKKQNQLKCKICNTLFPSQRVRIKGSKTKYLCPHCKKALYLWKSHSYYDIYKCGNRNCPYRKRRINSLTPEEKTLLKSNSSSQLKVNYQFRFYHFDPDELNCARPEDCDSDIFSIRNNLDTVGLVLTYAVSCGLSSRMTSYILRNVHNIDISHQTVQNYMKTSAPILYRFNDVHTQNLHDTNIVGDETYISVSAHWNYSWFVIGALSKAIASFHVSTDRSGINALLVLQKALDKLTAKTVDFTADGNPSYDSATVFINSQKNNTTLLRHKVIGLSNDDNESKKYRHLKQLIERLNRTYKFHTRARCGFKSLSGAVALTTLFVAYYNFLRPHKALNYNPPIHIKKLDSIPTLQGRWAQLLRLAA